MRSKLIFGAATALLLASCSDGEENSEKVGEGSAETDQASVEARSMLAKYLETNAENYDACFAALPEINAQTTDAQFAEGGLVDAAMNRVMIVIDASGSMAGRVAGQTKMSAAKASARTFVAELPRNVEVGLIAFGHRGDNSQKGKARSCAAVETVYPLGKSNADQTSRALGRFDATGWTPLADAIRTAGRSFRPSDVPGAQVVYVVSDGEETCGGDPVAAARLLHEGDVQAVINVIGFDLAARDRAQLEAVAKAGGGEFVAVDTPSALQEALRRRANSRAVGRTLNNANIQMGGNTLRTNTALSQLSTCISRAWSSEKRGVGAWVEDNGVDRDTAREMRGLIDARFEGYRERADEFERIARGRQDAAERILRDDQAQARREFENVQDD